MQYDTGSQTACAMPLALGIVEQRYRAVVLQKLIDDIRTGGNRVTAGDVGFRHVIDALGAAGRSDVIYDMVTRRGGPGYTLQLERGATTLTEAWDANPNVSQNHLMLGHAEIWFYRYLAGIQVDLSQPPPREIVIAPVPVASIESFEAVSHSALGKIAVRRNGRRFSVTIPPNVQATVKLPDREPFTVISGTHTF